MATKHVGLRKLFNIVLEANTSYLRKFLERHNVYIEQDYFDKIERYEQTIANAMQPKSSNEYEMKENAKTAIYVNISAAIEQIWNKHGATLATKPQSYTVRVISPIKTLVKKELQSEMDNIFVDLEDMIVKMQEKEEGDIDAPQS